MKFWHFNSICMCTRWCSVILCVNVISIERLQYLIYCTFVYSIMAIPYHIHATLILYRYCSQFIGRGASRTHRNNNNNIAYSHSHMSHLICHPIPLYMCVFVCKFGWSLHIYRPTHTHARILHMDTNTDTHTMYSVQLALAHNSYASPNKYYGISVLCHWSLSHTVRRGQRVRMNERK